MTNERRTLLKTGLAASLALGGCAHGPSEPASTTTPVEAIEVAEDEYVEEAPERALVTLSGRVVQSDMDSFELDYGSGIITVEMDDFDWMMEGSRYLTDDHVVVHGRIDADFYEKRTIEAAYVYVKGLGTEFYANAADEEEFAPFIAEYEVSDPRVEMAGEVTQVNEQSFDLKTPAGTVHVNTSQMPYNPLDDEGFQIIEEGEQVRVRGRLDAALFDTQELNATAVVSVMPGAEASS